MVEVGVIDYGAGNIGSLVNALGFVGAVPTLVQRPEDVIRFDRVVLPGVGAFQAAMAKLKGMGMDDALHAYVRTGRPLMGICLGMQLMCRGSTEEGPCNGLGWMAAQVLPIPREGGHKVPHMGWNGLETQGDHPLLRGVAAGADVYFVHSYCVACDHASDIIAMTEYGVTFVSAFARDNLCGVQFHPEKSQSAGLAILANFAGDARAC